MTVTVPQEFYDIGYSGLFHLESEMVMTSEEVEQWRTKVPCLLPQRGWMALEVVDGPCMVVVRRDADAMCDLVFQRKPN